MLRQFRWKKLTQEWAEATITLAREQGFPLWLGQGTMLQGWALAEQGQVEEGITQIRQGLATHEALGAGLFHSYYLVLLAEAYGKAGQAEDGLGVLTKALAFVDRTEERFYEAELYRIKGELLLAQEGYDFGYRPQGEDRRRRLKAAGYEAREKTEEAEGCFLRAIEIAQRQQAKSLELRAVMSMSRLWQQQGKQAEAHQMLSEIYNWFTEGFDTKDLQEAKALLEELA
jgi:predicted ATPase